MIESNGILSCNDAHEPIPRRAPGPGRWHRSVPFLFGLVGSIGGGWLADPLTKRGMTAITSRKLLTIGTVVAMALATFRTRKDYPNSSHY
jgi:hypothetical protein